MHPQPMPDPRLSMVQNYRPLAALVPPDWQAGDVAANGVRLHYHRTGGTRPPVVLLHGFQEMGLCWLPIMQALAPAYDLIALDARGHGSSAPATQGIALEQLAADVLGALDELKLAQVVLLGRSMGAATAVQVAATAPARVRAILLEDPPMRPMPLPDDAGYAAWFQSYLCLLDNLRAQPHHQRMATALHLLPPSVLWSEADYVPYVEAQIQFDPATLQHATADPALFMRWMTSISQVACPLLLMTGNPQRGGASSAEGIAAVQAAWQHGTHVTFAQAGHLISRDAPAAYLAAITRYLRQVHTACRWLYSLWYNFSTRAHRNHTAHRIRKRWRHRTAWKDVPDGWISRRDAGTLRPSSHRRQMARTLGSRRDLQNQRRR